MQKLPKAFRSGRGTHRFAAAFSVILALTSFAHPATAEVPHYSVTVLGDLGGAGGSEANGINSSGTAVGYAWAPFGRTQIRRAVAWTGPSAPNATVLPDFGAAGGSFASAANGSGSIVGYAWEVFEGNQVQRAVVWNGSSINALANLGGAGGSLAYGINASGLAAGHSWAPFGSTQIQRAVVWNTATPSAMPVVLADLGAAGGAIAYGINGPGQVAGQAWELVNGTQVLRAVLWTGNFPVVLSSLDGAGGSRAYAVNDSGVVVGQSWAAAGNNQILQAVIWNGTTPAIIPGFGGAGGSAAYGINNSGLVVGNSWVPSNQEEHGFLYYQGTVYDLTSLVEAGSGVTNILVGPAGNSINDQGQISGFGIKNGLMVAVLLNPVQTVPAVPPAGYAILGMALIGFGGFALRAGRAAVDVRSE